MYKKFMLVILLVMLMGSSVSAQFLGQMASARTKGPGSGELGTYLVLGDNITCVVGSVRFGLAPSMELRGRMGYLDPDPGDGSILVGGDFKYQVWDFERSLPCDLSFGAGLAYVDFDGYSVFGLGGTVTASMPFEAAKTASFEPYTAFNIRYQKEDFEAGPGNDNSDSSLEVALSLGCVFSLPRITDFTAEILIDDDTAFLVGFTFLKF